VRDERRLDMHHVDPARIDTSERAVECAADHQPIFRVHRHASRSDAVHARPDLADRPPRSAAPPACSGADRSRTSPAGRWRSRSRHRSRAGRTRPKSSGCARWPALVRWRARLPGSDDGRVTSSGSAPPGPAALVSTTGIGDRSAQPADVPAHTVIVGCQRPRPIVAGSDTRLQPLGRAAIGGCEPAA